MCVVDDAQWLDRASAQALAFVARRLLAESVVMLFAAREPSDEFAGLPELVVEGLGDADARALLASVIPGRLDERVADELLAETRGNPLALLELPRGLSAAQLAGGFGLPGALSLSGRIEESFLRGWRLCRRTPGGFCWWRRRSPTGDPALLWRAAERLGITGAALEPAQSAGLIEIDGRVRFRHPLVRSAVYRAATPNQRRRVHRALAEATDAQVDPDRRAWHLAEAAAGPDEDVAAELERAAGRAQARGGLAAAAAFLERAATLTRRARRAARERALAAAQTKYEAGALDDALALLATAETGALDDLQRARVHLLRAQIAFASRRGSDAPPLLLKAARELEAVDPALARATYLEALSAAMFAGRLARGGGRGGGERGGACRAAAAPAAAPAGPPPRGVGDPVHRGIRGGQRRSSRRRSRLPARHRAAAARRLVGSGSPVWIAVDLWDDEAWTAALDAPPRARPGGRGADRAAVCPHQRQHCLAVSGDLAEAASLREEMRAATEATGMATAPYGCALACRVARSRGRALAVDARPPRSDAQARGEGFALTITEFVSGTCTSGSAATTRPWPRSRKPSATTRSGPAIWALAELIEAAVRCGEHQLAEGALERLVETTGAAGTDWALGIEARSRALLSDGDDADALYREAIERLGRTRMRVELARAHLLYGEWLRRERSRRDAREQLRTAFEMFTSMGIEAFAGRAERELLATGERVRKRTVETRDELTAQEAQVARLARDGLSNAEIGARLFISQHTVAYHLRKVFTKLGITSRNELGRVLPQGAGVRQTA